MVNVTSMQNSIVRAQGFTLVELIMTISILGIVGVLVLPMLIKPFQVYQSSRAYQQASDRAIHVMHWIEKDLRGGAVAKRLSNENEVLIGKGDRSIRYRVQSGQLRRVVGGANPVSVRSQNASEQTIVDAVHSVQFKSRPPFLVMELTLGEEPHLVTFWNQWVVNE